MSPLSNPIFDAKTLADVLKTKYGFYTHLLPNPESVDVFRQELRRFTDSVKFGPRDELLVFMAGHGYYDTLDGFGYVAFSNTHKKNISEMYEMRNLVNILDNRPCKKIMLIMDVCFGGMLSQGLAQQSDPRLCNPATSFAKTAWPYNGTNAAQVYDFLNCSNRVYLTSGGYEYVSDGTPGAHSPFAEVLINSLNANNDDLVLSDEIVTQVKKNIKAKSTPQRPTSGRFGLDNNSTDFVFVKKAN
jgi:Caspase domain